MTKLNEIIQACQRGEELAQKLLYEQFSTKMRAICFRYLGNIEDAEDILHEGFIMVFTKINQFADRGSFEGWIKRIFINISLRHIKNTRKSSLVYGDEKILQWENENFSSPISNQDSEKPKDIINRMDFSRDELMNALQTLPEGYRIVFNLYVFEKNSHKEIAKLLSISENTSKSQLSRARKFLQQKLYEMSLERDKNEKNRQYKDFLKVVI